MLAPLLNGSRYLVIIAVLGSLAAAAALFIYGAAETVSVISHTIAKMDISSKGAKQLALSFIEIVDLFLLGTVLLMIALGLYELFIDNKLKLPEWLQIRTFDDLKNKLVGVVLVVLAVLFLGHVVASDGSRDLLGLGLAIAAVIAAPLGIGQAGTELLVPSVLGLGLVLAVLSAALPFSLEIEAMRRIPSATFGVMMSLEPAVAALVGLVILAQSVSLMEVVAIALVITASAGAVRSAAGARAGSVQP